MDCASEVKSSRPSRLCPALYCLSNASSATQTFLSSLLSSPFFICPPPDAPPPLALSPYFSPPLQFPILVRESAAIACSTSLYPSSTFSQIVLHFSSHTGGIASSRHIHAAAGNDTEATRPPSTRRGCALCFPVFELVSKDPRLLFTGAQAFLFLLLSRCCPSLPPPSPWHTHRQTHTNRDIHTRTHTTSFFLVAPAQNSENRCTRAFCCTVFSPLFPGLFVVGPLLLFAARSFACVGVCVLISLSAYVFFFGHLFHLSPPLPTAGFAHTHRHTHTYSRSPSRHTRKKVQPVTLSLLHEKEEHHFSVFVHFASCLPDCFSESIVASFPFFVFLFC